MTLRLSSLSFLLVLLSACAPGPTSTSVVAQQGLLSGDIAKDGSGAVIGSIHHGGSYWRLKDAERMYDWNLNPGGFSSFRSVAVSGDGSVAVTTEEDTVGVWNARTGESIGFWRAPNRVLSVDIDVAGQRAVLGLRDNQAVLVNLNSGEAIQEFSHDSEVRTVAIDGAGNKVLTGSDDGSAKLWDANNGNLIKAFTLENQVKTVALSESGDLAFMTAQRSSARVVDTNTLKDKFNLETRYTNYTAASIDEKQKVLILGTFQGEVHRHSLTSGERLEVWASSRKQMFGSATSKAILAVHALPKQIVALTSDGQIQRF